MEFGSLESEPKCGEVAQRASRRASERFTCARPHAVRIMLMPGLLSFPAHIHNFTRNGIGLSVQEPFDTGAVLAIQLRIAKTGLSCVLSATVVRCHEWYDNSWFLGCKLSRPLTDEETLSLL
jgi:hypothetical protein